ncbi:MAG: hypothetical protein EZS28_018009 [Streblomastix strix]|uniref:Uncharacterized protein n=1 Tax=Streblomastix strix TaxID=222440 RepID=A0A5J4VWB2_9EUKA|nr:MAG: hypothetical protein EZS28_018009 [Streblomastix strix]
MFSCNAENVQTSCVLPEAITAVRVQQYRICFEEEHKDSFNLETLAMPGDINSMIIVRIYRNIESIVIAKKIDQIILIKFEFIKKFTVYVHIFDCLFVLSIGGEWHFIQWNKTRFFSFATGSLLEAIQHLTKTPEKRCFRLDPTFLWAVSVVPITDNSPRFFSCTAPKSDKIQVQRSTKPIVRVSFRALIVVDEAVKTYEESKEEDQLAHYQQKKKEIPVHMTNQE